MCLPKLVNGPDRGYTQKDAGWSFRSRQGREQKVSDLDGEELRSMTHRLYYDDVYLKEFDAVVLDCRQEGGRWEIILDRSAFFPEGGGQNGDRGKLSDTCSGVTADVLDTREQDEDVILVCSSPMEKGSRVHGTLDWEYRFDRMQNHSGEHIVSGLIHTTFGYNNVGFHMSTDRMTIDLDGELSEDDLRDIERRANEIVWQNAAIRTDVYTEEEAENIEFRSKRELHGQIRVVSIPGADVCACCGTHVALTGEIGPIRIISHERFRGGIRMELMCGRWAYEYMTQLLMQSHEVSTLLSSQMHQIAPAVKKLVDDQNQMKGRMIGLYYEQIEKKAQELAGRGDVLIFADHYTPVLVQKLTARVMEMTPFKVFSFAGNDEEGYKYAVGQTDGDLKEFVKDMNGQLSGKGGGRPFFLQGSVSSYRESIEKYFSEKVDGIIIDTV